MNDRSQKMTQGLSRRMFLRSVAATGALSSLLGAGLDQPFPEKRSERLPVCIFSKHLQWLDWEHMAETAAELGFDGVDLTVRSGGHVEPERAVEDLPKVAKIIRKAGLVLPMVTTGIVDARSYSEPILRTLSELGIRRYRWGGLRYLDSMGIPERLAQLKAQVGELGEMNKKYRVCAMYHTHSGLEVGASIWDLWILLKDFDPNWLGVNFDVAHATIEGGLGGWVQSTRLIAPFAKGTAIKDFRWWKNRAGGWEPQWCSLGEGMVNFKRYLSMLKEASFSGPVQLHFEYPLGGAENGARTLTEEKGKVIEAMRRDLSKLRELLREAEL